MTRAASLHADAPADRRPAGAAALALQALSPAEITGDAEIVRTVIPAPGAEGRIETRDARGPLRVSDPAALAVQSDLSGVDGGREVGAALPGRRGRGRRGGARGAIPPAGRPGPPIGRRGSTDRAARPPDDQSVENSPYKVYTIFVETE